MTDGPLSLGPAIESRLLELLEESRALGFLGPGPVEEHLAHALDFAALAAAYQPARVLDLGSGGGLPGLVVFAALPAGGVLLDAQQRRTSFLSAAVERLGLADRVQVHTARAEVAGRDPELRHHFDVVLSRSFGPPAATAECAAPFLAPSGRVIVSEPPAASGRVRWPVAGLELVSLERVELPIPVSHGFVVLHATAPCAARFPRRDGMPAKRPLWSELRADLDDAGDA